MWVTRCATTTRSEVGGEGQHKTNTGFHCYTRGPERGGRGPSGVFPIVTRGRSIFFGVGYRGGGGGGGGQKLY